MDASLFPPARLGRPRTARRLTTPDGSHGEARPVLYRTVISSPIGDLHCAATDAGIIWLGSRPARGELQQLHGGSLVTDPNRFRSLAAELDEYFAGTRRRFEQRIDLGGLGSFRTAVYRAAMRIPYGSHAAYSDLARMIGAPRAARAVGGAMAACPITILVPCHRVVRADGSASGRGARRRDSLLRFEEEAASSSTFLN